MKSVLFVALGLVSSMAVFAQVQSPVTWSYAGKKTADNLFEVSITATIQKGWHLYSQTQPKDAIAQPTAFKFNNNPLLQLDGNLKENGKVEKFTDKELGVSANQYSNQVVFTQRVKLKGKAKSNVSGSVTFQTCNDERCLPPKTINFSVALN